MPQRFFSPNAKSIQIAAIKTELETIIMQKMFAYKWNTAYSQIHTCATQINTQKYNVHRTEKCANAGDKLIYI